MWAQSGAGTGAWDGVGAGFGAVFWAGFCSKPFTSTVARSQAPGCQRACHRCPCGQEALLPRSTGCLWLTSVSLPALAFDPGAGIPSAGAQVLGQLLLSRWERGGAVYGRVRWACSERQPLKSSASLPAPPGERAGMVGLFALMFVLVEMYLYLLACFLRRCLKGVTLPQHVLLAFSHQRRGPPSPLDRRRRHLSPKETSPAQRRS